MKRYIRSEQMWGRKRKNIDKSEYQPAIEAGKLVLSRLSELYPEVFSANPTKITRSHAWANHLYVELGTGIKTNLHEISSFQDILDYEQRISHEIKDDIMPELGISWDDFQISLSTNRNYSYYTILVFDMNTDAWEQNA